ncbi:helix-turn-helix transcriptional regulator [Pedobacter sp. PAMC26386]|nr:helix-turn-helix transcriptional regulator [Pedobacter sp. PAMC26386]
MENNTINDPQSVIKQENHEQLEDNCSMTNAWQIIGGKWKLPLLNAIRKECPARFGELRKKMQEITQTTLTTQLRELERDGIISRKVYAESPPRVEYKLTELGKTLIPVMDILSDWSDTYCKATKVNP